MVARKRVTVMIDEDLDRRLRVLQGKESKRSHKHCSYSQIINEIVKDGLRYTC